MKKLLLAVLLFVLVSIQSYPQNIIPLLNSSAKYSEQPLHPGIKNIPGESLPLAPAKLINMKIYKSTDIKGSDFRPVKVISDTVHIETYSYDSSNNLISVVSENLVDGVWVTWFRFTYTYDNKGNTKTAHTETYNSGIVKDTYDATYTYDASGKLLSVLSVNKMYGVFQNSSRSSFTYDSNGNTAAQLYEKGTSGGTWENDIRFSYTYDSRGKVLTEFMEVWQAGAWKNGFRTVYTYDLKGNVTATLGEIWKDSLWAKGSEGTYTYDDNGKLLTHVFESWDGNRLAIKNRWTYSYDSNGNVIENLVGQWLNNDWSNYRKGIWTYDDHGNALKGESFEWSNDSKWVPINSGIEMSYNFGKDHLEAGGAVVEVEYAASVADAENTPTTVNEYTLSQNYPNPFNPSTTINYSLKKEGNVKLTVFDALGKRVAVAVDEFKPAGSYSVKFDGSSLPSGMYIYRLEAGEFTAAKKFVLLK